MIFVHDISAEKFAETLAKSEIQNQHFSASQFEKNYDTEDMIWCMLFGIDNATHYQQLMQSTNIFNRG